MTDAATICGGIENLLNSALRFVEQNTTAVILSEAFLNLSAEMMKLIF
jgi:BTB And C-terminal Kelch